jgi:hypothetical protein
MSEFLCQNKVYIFIFSFEKLHFSSKFGSKFSWENCVLELIFENWFLVLYKNLEFDRRKHSGENELCFLELSCIIKGTTENV